MSEPPFGFGLPGQPGDDQEHGSGGASGSGSGGSGTGGSSSGSGAGTGSGGAGGPRGPRQPRGPGNPRDPTGPGGPFGDPPALTGGAGAGGLGGLGLGGLSEMMRRVGGMMVGGQAGAAVGTLAEDIISSSDIGLPIGPEGTAALLPAGVAAFGAGLSVGEDEVRLFVAMREAAHHRLFSQVPWLQARLLSAVEDYARGINVDVDSLPDALHQH